MQVFRISHADLYRQPAKGVTVSVPVGTRSIRLCPTAAAVPVEVWPDIVPPDAKVQDGQLVHAPGETLYPGDTLLLKEGCTTVLVRLPPSLNAGAEQWLSVYSSFYPFGEDARRPVLYGNDPWGTADIIDGPWPTTDGLACGIKDAQMVFVASRELQLHHGTGMATVPHTMTLPALYNDPAQEDAAAPNVAFRASVQNNLTSNAPGSDIVVSVVAPWHLVPFGLLSRFQRVRLRLGACNLWKPSRTTVGSAYFQPYSVGGPSPVNQIFRKTVQPLGSFAQSAGFPAAQYLSARGSSWEIDLGTPTEVFSLLAGSPDKFVGEIRVCDPDVEWAAYPALWGQWIFDNAPSKPGNVTSWARFGLAGQNGGAFVDSPRGTTVVKGNVSNIGLGASVRAWRADEKTMIDTTTTPDFSVPITDAVPQTFFMLPVGTWYVDVTGAATGAFEASEG